MAGDIKAWPLSPTQSSWHALKGHSSSTVWGYCWVCTAAQLLGGLRPASLPSPSPPQVLILRAVPINCHMLTFISESSQKLPGEPAYSTTIHPSIHTSLYPCIQPSSQLATYHCVWAHGWWWWEMTQVKNTQSSSSGS